MRSGRARSRQLISIAIAAALAAPSLAAAAVDAPSGDSGSDSSSSGSLPGGVQSALTEVTIMAQRTPAEVAVEAQEQAPNLIDIATAIEIQRLPDVNTGEAVRRVPGISLETDTGR